MNGLWPVAVFLCGAACALAQNAAAPRFDRWTVIGPGGGGSMFVPTVSPHTADDVMVACDMTGAYVSHDGGRSWRMFNLRGVVGQFVFDPLDRNVVYASTGPLWRSTDRARTWRLVYPDPSSVRIEMIDDHAGARHIGKDGRAARVTALAIDPADSKTLYASISGELSVSRDWGRTWTKIAESGASRIWIDPRSPKADRTLYVSRLGTLAIRKGGAWTTAKAPADFADFAAGFAPDPIFYGMTSAGLYVSGDGGASWRATGLHGPARYKAIAASLNHGRTAYVSYSRHGNYFGVAKTTDGGRTWSPVWRESRDAPGPNIHDAWLTPKFGPDWTGSPFALGVAPNDPEVAYGTDFGRTMRTADGGKNWDATYSRRVDERGWTSTGLDVTTNYGIHFDPFDSKRWFITYTDIGLVRSEDGGASWVPSTDGVPQRWVNTTYWIEFDPKVKGRAWAVASGIHDLPRPKMWRRQAVANYNGGVIASEDGGRTWRVSGALPPTAATHILLDPGSPAGSRTLYVAGFGRGVFKSTDGGKTWELRKKGIGGAEPFAWRLARAGDGTQYLVVARRSDDGSIGDARDGALYRSTDGAASWTKMPLPAGVNGPNGLAVDPKDNRRLYLAAWRRAIRRPDGGGGVYLSTDAGASWKRVLSADQHVYDITATASAVYACGFSSSAWRSMDRGLTWQRIRGFNFKWGHRVIPDPRDPARIFVTTFGGSVWHGPAAGDPAAVEDIVTPEVAYSKP